MQNSLAGILTVLISVLVYAYVSTIRNQLEGFGTDLPKYMEVAIAFPDTAVNFYYASLPLLFRFFRYLVGIFMADNPGAED